MSGVDEMTSSDNKQPDTTQTSTSNGGGSSLLGRWRDEEGERGVPTM